MFLIAVVCATCAPTARAQWVATDLEIDPDYVVWPGRGSTIFSPNGERLFLGVKDKVEIYRTTDGERIRELKLPPRHKADAEPNRRAVAWTPATTRIQQLCVTLGGKKLLVLTYGRVFLADLKPLVDGGEVAWEHLGIPDTYKGKGWHRFVCSIGDDRLVFTDAEFSPDQPRQTRLVVYRLSTKRLDGGAAVNLATVSAATPQFLSAHYFSPHTFLAGESESGKELLGIRVTPDGGLQNSNSYRSNVACTYEKIKISWDERGYGKLRVTETGRLSRPPAAITPSMDHFLGLGYKQINDKFFYVPAGVGPIQPGGNARLVRDVFGEHYRGLGLAGLWSGNGEVLLINDAHDTRKLRETKITVHDETGNQQAVLRTGTARSAEVLAVSADGTKVVTHADIDHRPVARANGMHRRIQLWTLR